MVKKDWKVWEIVTESLAAAAAVVYLGLQIYYGYLYESMGTAIVYRVLPAAFLYAGMTVLEIVPELLNAGGKEKLGGEDPYLCGSYGQKLQVFVYDWDAGSVCCGCDWI